MLMEGEVREGEQRGQALRVKLWQPNLLPMGNLAEILQIIGNGRWTIFSKLQQLVLNQPPPGIV